MSFVWLFVALTLSKRTGQRNWRRVSYVYVLAFVAAFLRYVMIGTTSRGIGALAVMACGLAVAVLAYSVRQTLLKLRALRVHQSMAWTVNGLNSIATALAMFALVPLTFPGLDREVQASAGLAYDIVLVCGAGLLGLHFIVWRLRARHRL